MIAYKFCMIFYAGVGISTRSVGWTYAGVGISTRSVGFHTHSCRCQIISYIILYKNYVFFYIKSSYPLYTQ